MRVIKFLQRTLYLYENYRSLYDNLLVPYLKSPYPVNGHYCVMQSKYVFKYTLRRSRCAVCCVELRRSNRIFHINNSVKGVRNISLCALYYIQYFSGSNTDGSFTTVISNSFLSTLEKSNSFYMDNGMLYVLIRIASIRRLTQHMRSLESLRVKENRKDIPYMPHGLALRLTLISINYP